jgi:imidazolonepropionase-like amidohydrolase
MAAVVWVAQVGRVRAALWLMTVAIATGRPSPVRTQASPTLVIANATVIDGTGAAPRLATVVIEGSRIATVSGSASVPNGATRVDGTGKFLIPGLWDMHVHLLHADSGVLGVFLANGVTGVREMGGDAGRTAAWRGAIEASRLVGPRLFYAGPILEAGNYFVNLERMERELGTGFFPLMQRTRIAVAGPGDARAAVDSIRRTGAQFVKVRTASNRATFLALLEESRRAGLPLVGHAPQGASPADLARAGMASVEHGFFPPLFDYLPAERAALFGEMARHGTRMTPTMVSGRWARIVPDSVSRAVIADTANRLDPRRRYVNDAQIAYWGRFFASKRFESPLDWPFVWRAGARDVTDAHAAGVQLLTGTDFGAAMIFPGFALHEELALLVSEAKVPPMQVLTAATRNAARFLGAGDSLGTIEADRAADLVLLDADPLADIRNTQRIAAVIVRGRLFDRAALDSLLETGARLARRTLRGARP